MLDDLKVLHQRDKFDVLGAAERQASRLADAVVFSPHMPQPEIHNIVCIVEHIAASEAQMIKLITRCTLPFEIVDYEIPVYVGGNTLCIVVCNGVADSSLLALANEAATAGATVVVVITAGNNVLSTANLTRFQVVPVAADISMTTGYVSVCKAIAQVLEAYKLTHGIVQELSSQAEWLPERIGSYKPDVPVKSNYAKQVALELIGKAVVIYAGPLLEPIANHWKTAINTYSKQLAWVGKIGGGVLGDIEGWTKQPVHKPYAIVELRSQWEKSDIQRRQEAADRLLSGLRPSPIVINLQESTLLRDMVHASALGDMVAAYLAIAGGIDPGSTQMMTKFMKEVA